MSGVKGRSGGKRPGAGRPKGSVNPRTRVLNDLAAKVAAGETGQTPLELMIACMNYLQREAIRCEREGTVMIDGSGDARKVFGPTTLRLMACEVASKAAPYVHPRLAQVEAKVKGELSIYEASLRALAGDVQPKASKGVH